MTVQYPQCATRCQHCGRAQVTCARSNRFDHRKTIVKKRVPAGPLFLTDLLLLFHPELQSGFNFAAPFLSVIISNDPLSRLTRCNLALSADHHSYSLRLAIPNGGRVHRPSPHEVTFPCPSLLAEKDIATSPLVGKHFSIRRPSCDLAVLLCLLLALASAAACAIYYMATTTRSSLQSS